MCCSLDIQQIAKHVSSQISRSVSVTAALLSQPQLIPVDITLPISLLHSPKTTYENHLTNWGNEAVSHVRWFMCLAVIITHSACKTLVKSQTNITVYINNTHV